MKTNAQLTSHVVPYLGGAINFKNTGLWFMDLNLLCLFRYFLSMLVLNEDVEICVYLCLLYRRIIS